jgi:hypothetical protein
MTTEKQPGITDVQPTQIESRHLQAEFLHGDIMDGAQMSVPSFPKGSSDGCSGQDTCSCSTCRATNDDFPLSISRC